MKRTIYIIISTLLMVNSFASTVNASGQYPTLPDVSETHYIIYESSDNNRIEATFFNISDDSPQYVFVNLPLIFTYGGSDLNTGTKATITLSDNSKLVSAMHYYFDGEQWVYTDSNNYIGTNVSKLIDSDLPYYEVLGKGNSETLQRGYVDGKCLYSKAGSVYVSMSDGIHDFKQLEFEYKFPNGYLEENYVTDIDKFVSGNGLNVIVGFEDYTDNNSVNSEQYLEKYKFGDHSNSPIQIFDSDFNLIKTVDYSGCFDIEFFYNGNFYMKHRDYSNVSASGGERIDKYYKTDDIENRVEITLEEYENAKNTKDHNINQQTATGYAVYKEKLIDKSTLKEYDIVRETGKYNGEILNNGYPSYCYLYNTDDRTLTASDVSLDGVYGVPIPIFEKGKYGGRTFYSWASGEYIYFDAIYMDYFYRLPISQMTNLTYVRLNDKILGFDQPPVMESDRTLVPMRFLFEQMGAEVTWDDATQSATATINASALGAEAKSATGQAILTDGAEPEKSVTFAIDNTTATVNGAATTMDVPARLINDQTFVPLRFLSENLGYTVDWDETANTAIITTD